MKGNDVFNNKKDNLKIVVHEGSMPKLTLFIFSCNKYNFFGGYLNTWNIFDEQFYI